MLEASLNEKYQKDIDGTRMKNERLENWKRFTRPLRFCPITDARHVYGIRIENGFSLEQIDVPATIRDGIETDRRRSISSRR